MHVISVKHFLSIQGDALAAAAAGGGGTGRNSRQRLRGRQRDASAQWRPSRDRDSQHGSRHPVGGEQRHDDTARRRRAD